VDQRRPPLDAQTTGQDAALQDSAIDTGRHGIGNRPDSDRNLSIFPPGALVGPHDSRDRQLLVRRNPEQVRARTEAVRHVPQAAFGTVAADLVLVQNRAAADRIIDAALDRLIILESSEPHGIAVEVEPLFLVEDQVRRFVKGD